MINIIISCSPTYYVHIPYCYDVGLELLDEGNVKDLHVIRTNHATNVSL